MPNLNKVLLIGRLTRDPETKFLPTGTALCEFGFAVDDGYGEKKRTCFLDVVAWTKTGEMVQKYCQKGKEVLIEGHLTFEEWQDKATGKKRSKIKVVADRVQFLGRGDGGQGRPGPQPHAAAGRAPDEFPAPLPVEDAEGGELPF